MQFAPSHPWPVRVTTRNQAARWAARFVVAFSSLILLLSLFLAARRLGGAMSAPLSALPLVGTAIFLLLWAWFVQTIGSRFSIDEKNQFLKRCQWAPFASLTLVAFACSYPFTRPADWLVWLPTFAAAWFGPQRLSLLQFQSRLAHNQRPLANSATRESTDRVLQQLTRFRTPDGRDALRGTLTAEFAPGERNATLYIAFCPPFERLPDVSVDFDDELLAAVKLTQVLHNGAQLDVRLSNPAAVPTACGVEIFAAEPTHV